MSVRIVRRAHARFFLIALLHFANVYSLYRMNQRLKSDETVRDRFQQHGAVRESAAKAHADLFRNPLVTQPRASGYLLVVS